MKKVISLLLVVLLLASLSISAFAEFGPSVFGNGEAPETEAVTATNNDGTAAKVTVVPMSEKTELTEDDQAALAKLQKTNLNTAAGVEAGTKLAVESTFDVESDASETNPITLTFPVSANFASLLMFVNGEWVKVPVTVEDGKITVTVTDPNVKFSIVSEVKA